MLGKVKSIVQFKKGICVLNLDVNGHKAKTYIDNKNANSGRWKGIVCGDYLMGLEWYDEDGGVIDGDSPVVIVKK
jgi:hypothetical protein